MHHSCLLAPRGRCALGRVGPAAGREGGAAGREGGGACAILKGDEFELVREIVCDEEEVEGEEEHAERLG